MKAIIRILILLATGSSVFSTYAANPVSKEYVDSQIQSLQRQINSIQPGIIYTAGAGISITNNVITVTDATPTYSLYQQAQGGVIYYLDRSNAHGLAAALVNQSDGIQWSPNTDTTGAELVGIYLGKQNTARITQYYSASPIGSYAASLCATYNGGGYTDWYLPTRDELVLMYIASKNTTDLPQDTNPYWTSTEYPNNSNQAWNVDFSNGNLDHTRATNMSLSVRCIRSF